MEQAENMMNRKMRRSNSIAKNLRRLQGFDTQVEYDHGKSAEEEHRYLFEIAWEVANKGTDESRSRVGHLHHPYA